VRGSTYFSLHAAKKSRQKKAAQTADAKRAPWFATGSGASGIRVLAHSALVTKDSSAPTPHCVRRGRVCMGNHGLRLRSVGGPSASPRRGASALTREPPLPMKDRVSQRSKLCLLIVICNGKPWFRVKRQS